MTKAELARAVLRTDLSEEGWCAHCKARVGNWHPSNDYAHKDWCIVLVLRRESTE